MWLFTVSRASSSRRYTSSLSRMPLRTSSLLSNISSGVHSVWNQEDAQSNSLDCLTFLSVSYKTRMFFCFIPLSNPNLKNVTSFFACLYFLFETHRWGNFLKTFQLDDSQKKAELGKSILILSESTVLAYKYHPSIYFQYPLSAALRVSGVCWSLSLLS